MSLPKVSVIICAYNRADQVITCLESLLRLEYDDVEIVVVDDASTDDTPARLESFRDEHPEANIQIVRNPRNLGVSGARNSGLAAACGELVAFTDSDCTADPAWLRELAAVFDTPEVAAASGTVLDETPRSWAERASVGSCRVGQGRQQNRSLVGCNMGFRRKIAADYGFEPELAYGCDEDELAWRLTSVGYQTRFAPAAIIHHNHPMDLAGYLRIASKQGQGSARYGYKRGFYLGRDLLFLTAAFFSLPLALLDPRWLALSAAFFLLQLAAMLFNEIAFKGKSPLEAVIVLPAVGMFNTVKLWNVLRMQLRIALGLEPNIRSSKQRWRARLQKQLKDRAGDPQHAFDGR